MQGDAATIAALFAVDPVGLGGVALRSPACDNRDQWLALLKSLLPSQTPLRRVPLNINDTALLGGLDLGATLQAGKPMALKGLLSQADGGVLVLAMAERMSLSSAARFGSVLDTGMVALQRDGLDTSAKASLGLVALDEGASDDEQMPAGLADRLAFRLLMGAQDEDEEGPEWTAQEVLNARERLSQVTIDDEAVQALAGAHEGTARSHDEDVLRLEVIEADARSLEDVGRDEFATVEIDGQHLGCDEVDPGRRTRLARAERDRRRRREVAPARVFAHRRRQRVAAERPGAAPVAAHWSRPRPPAWPPRAPRQCWP